MKILNITKYLLAIGAIIFIFFNWQISLVLFIIASLFYAFPLGPNYLLGVITGELLIAGLIFLFINWKIGIVLIFGGFLVTKFRAWTNIKNHEYYTEKNKRLAKEKE